MIEPARPAATVIVLRPSAERFSVFLVKRHRKSGFMPTAWVFPGGRVDGTDALHEHPRVRGGDTGCRAMGLDRFDGLPFLVAALRETYEESGIWLGTGCPDDAVRDALNARSASIADVLAEPSLAMDLDRLKAWSWWVTPRVEPRRYDTRFFVACVDDAVGRHDDLEVVDSAWLGIDEAVARAEAGELHMAPPTWWTLRELAALPDLDAVRASVRPADRAIEPILSVADGALELCLPGHPQHDAPTVPGLPSSLGFRQGHWWHEG